MRKVTARELHAMGVKGGPDLPLPSDLASKIALAKIQICNALEKLYGDDMKIWIRVLQRAQQQPAFQKEPHKTAVEQLLKELEREAKR